MKKILFIFLIYSCGTCLGQITFEKAYSLAGYDLQGIKVIQNIDGTYLILATAWWPGGSLGKGCLVKTDSTGNILWTKLYSELYFNNIFFTSFEQTADNAYLISGIARHINSARQLMMKVDSFGNIIWSNCYGSPNAINQNAAWCVKVLSDGNYLMSGITSDYGAGMRDFYLIKTDTSGNTLWSRTLGTGLLEISLGVEIAANGNFVMMGLEDLIGTTLAEFDNNGNLIWNKTYSLPNSDGLTQWAVKKCPDNGFAIVGVWDADTTGFWPYLLKTDSSGNVMWCKLYTQNTWPATVGEFFDVRITSDSGFILTWEPEHPCQYCRTGLIKTDSLGNIEWSKNYTLNKYTFPSSAIQTSDLGYVVVGHTLYGINFLKTDINGNTGGCYDTSLAVIPINLPVTISTHGTLDSGYVLNTFNPIVTLVTVTDTNNCLSVNVSESEIKNQASQIQIFPNPAYQNISITTQNLHGKKVEIKITDMLGQILLSRDENTFGDGNLTTIINIESLASGIYFVSVCAGGNNIVRKLVVE